MLLCHLCLLWWDFGWYFLQWIWLGVGVLNKLILSFLDLNMRNQMKIWWFLAQLQSNQRLASYLLTMRSTQKAIWQKNLSQSWILKYQMELQHCPIRGIIPNCFFSFSIFQMFPRIRCAVSFFQWVAVPLCGVNISKSVESH